MSYLQISGLGKDYGALTVVDSIDISIEKGEFISLLGPSGCGKTTTLQMVAGFAAPSRGSIVLDSKDITHESPEKRDIGVVFQSYALFPHMTVSQNISFGLEMRGLGTSARNQRIKEALELVQLPGLSARYPAELSGGQRQRVAIARALAIQPRLLLLDEPMSNLDAKLREEMHIELRSIQRQLGITTILVTHDQAEAMTMSDRVALLHAGRLEQICHPYEAYENPRTLFASTFLGKANIIRGKVLSTTSTVAHILSEDIRFTAQFNGVEPRTDQAIAFIRPEKIRIDAKPADSHKLDGIITNIVFLGSNWLYEINTSLGKFKVVRQNDVNPGTRLNDRVSLSWNEADLQLVHEE